MNNNEYTTIGLYNHNVDSYNKIKSSFESGNDIVGIVHATGTGKSYNALQLAYDNKDKKIVYVVPSNGIIEHINKIIEDNPNLDIKRDFPNLEFRTYQSFISLSRDEISNIDCDLLILDEFHHIGAPVWGARIDTMIETHPDIKVFGMTAYTVRDRGTSYEKDMADPDTDELFSGKIESRYDLCDAMIDGVLPKPIYKTAYTNLIGMEKELEEKVRKLGANTKEYQEYMKILTDVKKRIHEAPSIANILKSIKPNGKYIYFCPPCSEEGTNDIETIKKQAIEWFKEFVPKEDIIIYTSTSDMGKDGKRNRDAFYNDVTLDGETANNKLRIMFAINQYNEGIHAPNIDGVIMGRGTSSDIVYFEQLGRALSVRGNTKEKFDELEQYSIQELIDMCKEKDIPIKDDASKEVLIESLIAPVIIDLANNYEFIKELENNLRDRIKDIQKNGVGNHREIRIRDASFDIEVENQDLYEMLRYVMDRLTMTWKDKFELAKAYYEHHGNLEVKKNFKTINGYEKDENGIDLAIWIDTQRKAYQGRNHCKITTEQIELLKSIGMRFENIDSMQEWMKKFELAKAYYEHHGNLEVKQDFETVNGYEPAKEGEKCVKLGSWISNQRQAYQGRSTSKITTEQIELLKSIGMRFENIDPMQEWMKKFELAKTYYEHHGNLEVKTDFETVNGYEPAKEGEKCVKLGSWIVTQRLAYQGRSHCKITTEQIELLKSIGMRFETKNIDDEWMKKFELAKTYYEHHGNLEVKQDFETVNGYEPAKEGEKSVKLGRWISIQRIKFKEGKISDEKIRLLKNIGMIFDDLFETKWMKKYKLAKAYSEHHNGSLNVPVNFKTVNGYEPAKEGDEGINLTSWINVQRQAYRGHSSYNITQEQIKLLENIGMVWFIEKINDKLQQEEITSKNSNAKQKEIQNRFYSVLNNHDDNTLPLSDELNNELIDSLNKNIRK